MKFFKKIFNYYVLSEMAAKLVELYALITGKGFFCRALKGDSFYNICINSDLTVSCNCNDSFGLGRIGDIKKNSLKEILTGEKASQFRKSLAKVKLPMGHCLFCGDLRLVDKEAAKEYVNDFNIPKGIMIENTVNCNLNCTSCGREKIYSLRSKRSMVLEDLERVAGVIKENNIKHISYFSLGEPFFSDNIKKELEIMRKYNPDITIAVSTNGILVDSKEKQEAALFFDIVFFSIHGSTQKSANKYQKGIDFNKAYSNMKALTRFRDSLDRKKPKIIWKYVLFNWNDNKKLITNAIKLSKEAKVDKIYFEKTLTPLHGISYKYYLGLGYLNKIAKFDGKRCMITLNNKENA